MSDHGLHVVFYTEAAEVPFKSEEQGRPIFDDFEYVRILIPGDNKTVIERIATDTDKKKYAAEYKRFKDGLADENQASGTPIKEWGACRPSMAKEFAAQSIFTVEQLANLSDTSCQSFGMGAIEWREKAKAFLATTKDTAAAQKFAAENEDLRRQLADLQSQFAAFSAQSDKRGPGRPARDAAA
jgi:hypothetical protein